MARILCVDDEPGVATVLEHALERVGHEPILVSSVREALGVLDRESIDLIISDYRMPGATGLDLLSTIREKRLNVPVIMMTGYSTIEHAVISIRSGAIDYLTKPVVAETLEIAVNQALEVVRLRSENNEFRREINSLRAQRKIIGDGPAMQAIQEMISTVGATRATVLLHGESGTGKELFARALHDCSPRHDKPFISLNCAAMPEGLVESALFGHEKGAFTGATARSAGAFERADGGTLMLDEISEMRVDLQAKLLRVLQEQEFERVGGQRTISVDVRLVATTNRDLQEEMREGRFREDLFYRLNVIAIRTPPLRERPEDIPALVRFFVGKYQQENESCRIESIAPETFELLQQHSWPGNVRELANAVERAAILSVSNVLLPEGFAGLGSLSPTAPETSVAGNATNGVVIPAGVFDLDEIERLMIDRAVEATGGNRTRAAKLLGVSERTLRNKLNVKAPVS